MKAGTLKELNVRAGDVVEGLFSENSIAEIDGVLWCLDQGGFPWLRVSESIGEYTLISRATTEPLPHGHVTLSDGRTIDLTANRVRCDLMDPEELQAMKDHGGPWEKWGLGEWSHCSEPMWITAMTYRVAPKPVVETVVLYGELYVGKWGRRHGALDTHRITLTIQDGDTIDTKTEKL